MARQDPKVKPKKPVVKLQYTSNYSSCEEPDHLSYSYSCLKSFKINQHKVRELVRLRQDQHYEQLSDESMFSYLGDKTKPVYEDKKDSEWGQVNNYKFDYKDNVKKVEQNSILKCSNNEVGPDFSEIIDKNLFYKWLRYQFKCVNSLWPFSMSRCSVFSKLSNKTRNMKMEVFLSSVDEKTKLRLKKYVNDLDLSLEERSTLCNESLIEIDITPIIADNTRLQEFLAFIHSIESNSTRATVDDPKREKKQVRLLQNRIVQDGSFKQQNENNLTNNICEDFYTTKKKHCTRKSTTPGNSSMECLYICPGMGGDTVGSEKSLRKQETENETSMKKNTFKRGQEKNKYYLKINPITRKCSIKNIFKSSSICDQYSSMETDKAHNVAKKQRFHSTIPAKGQAYCKDGESKVLNDDIQNSNRNQCNKLPVYNKKLGRFHQGRESVDRCVQLEKTFSCKCLMHLEREDYKRYRNQCLFGKGESYNLKKYVSIMEKKSKLKVHRFGNSSNIHVDDDSKENDTETISSHESLLLSNKTKTKRHTQVDNIDSTTTYSSTLTQNESCNVHQTGLHDNFQRKDFKNPEKYDLSSRVTRKVEESCYKNDTKVSRSFLNSSSKKVTKCNPTKGVKASLSQTLLLNDYQVIHIQDVEELVCEVSYSDTSCITSCTKTIISSSSSDTSCNITDKMVDQESTNACFESLNYSINSISGGTTSESFKRNSSENINSNDTNRLNKKENTSEKSFRSSQNKLKSVETNKITLNDRHESPKLLTYKNQTLKEQCSVEKVDYVRICHEHKKNFRRKRTSHSMKARGRSLIKSQSEREQQNIGENNQNTSEKINESTCVVDDGKINSKICVLEDNTRKLQSKITELIEQLQCINMKQMESNKGTNERNKTFSNYSKNCPKSSNKTRMVINIDDPDKQSQNVLCVRKSNKNYLHFIKPQNIYKSISTIFRKSVENNNDTSKEKGHTILINRPTKIARKKSHEKDCVQKENYTVQKNYLNRENSISLEVSPNGVYFNKQEEYSAILNNLEKLSAELSFQNNEIQFLKEYLKDTKK